MDNAKNIMDHPKTDFINENFDYIRNINELENTLKEKFVHHSNIYANLEEIKNNHNMINFLLDSLNSNSNNNSFNYPNFSFFNNYNVNNTYSNCIITPHSENNIQIVNTVHNFNINSVINNSQTNNIQNSDNFEKKNKEHNLSNIGDEKPKINKKRKRIDKNKLEEISNLSTSIYEKDLQINKDLQIKDFTLRVKKSKNKDENSNKFFKVHKIKNFNFSEADQILVNNVSNPKKKRFKPIPQIEIKYNEDNDIIEIPKEKVADFINTVEPKYTEFFPCKKIKQIDFMIKHFDEYLTNRAKFNKSLSNINSLVVKVTKMKNFEKSLSPIICKRLWRANLIDNSKSIININNS